MKVTVVQMTIVVAASAAIGAALRALSRRRLRRNLRRKSTTANPISAGNLRRKSTTATPISEFLFLGTGVSTGLPRISCILNPLMECRVCDHALKYPLEENRRCNVSALVRLGPYNVLIDCGKTVREAILRWGPQNGVEAVDAVCLTHGHADAMMGLDDLRDIQRQSWNEDAEGKRYGLRAKSPTPVYLNEETMDICKNSFPYLMPKKPTQNSMKRRVSAVLWKPFKTSEYFTKIAPIEGVGIHFTPIPLYHGKRHECMGYIITGSFENNSVIAYLSDVSEVPEHTMEELKKLVRIDLLVVDALQRRHHPAHFSLQDAIDLAKVLRPARTLLVGMSCEMGFHDERNRELKKLKASDDLDISLAFDGMRIPL